MNLDENIAKIKLDRRRLQEETEKKEDEKPEISVEDLKKAVEEGELVFGGKTYEFERRSLLDGKIQIPVVKDILKEMNMEKDAFVFMNESRGISFTGSFITEKTMKQSFTQFKEGMKQQFKGMGLYLEWMEENQMEKNGATISYGWFLSPTGYGNTLNLIFYLPQSGGTVIGNYNCFEKDAYLWKPLIEACLQLMDYAKE